MRNVEALWKAIRPGALRARLNHLETRNLLAGALQRRGHILASMCDERREPGRESSCREPAEKRTDRTLNSLVATRGFAVPRGFDILECSLGDFILKMSRDSNGGKLTSGSLHAHSAHLLAFFRIVVKELQRFGQLFR